MRTSHVGVIAIAIVLGLSATACSGCTTSARLTPLGYGKIESKHTAATVQTCRWTQELATEVDRASECLEQAHRYRGRHVDLRIDPIWVCQIEQPEMCDSSRQRKAGCSRSSGQIWVARWWPPVCAPEWPGERCVMSHADQQDVGLREVAHEIDEVIYARLGYPLGSAHTPEALSLLRGCLDGPSPDR